MGTSASRLGSGLQNPLPTQGVGGGHHSPAAASNAARRQHASNPFFAPLFSGGGGKGGKTGGTFREQARGGCRTDTSCADGARPGGGACLVGSLSTQMQSCTEHVVGGTHPRPPRPNATTGKHNLNGKHTKMACETPSSPAKAGVTTHMKVGQERWAAGGGGERRGGARSPAASSPFTKRGLANTTPPFAPTEGQMAALATTQPATVSSVRRESSLSDITMSDLSHASFQAGDQQGSSSSRASLAGVNSSLAVAGSGVGGSLGNTPTGANLRNTRGSLAAFGEDLEQQRQQAPLSIEEDLFIYDDIVISKNEARTKHWRLAGRKVPFNADGHRDSAAGGAGGRLSLEHTAGKRLSDSPQSAPHAVFSFTDFDVCVDEVDIMLNHDSAVTGAAVGIATPPHTPTTAAFAANSRSTPTRGPATGAAARRTVTFAGRKATVTNVVMRKPNLAAAQDARRKIASSGLADAAPRCLTALQTTVLTGHASRVKCIAVAPSEQDYASCSNEDASISLTNLRLKDEVGIFTGHQETIINATFSPDGKYLATTSKDRTMILWDVVTNKQLLTYEHSKVVICCGFSPDSKYIVSGCQDRICRLWDTRRGSEWLSYTNHDGIIISVTYSPDGGHVCSASADKTLRVWSATTAKTRFTLTGHIGIILACNYTTDGRFIVSNDESQLRVWSTEDGSCTLSMAPGEVAGASWPGMKGLKLGWTLSCNAPGAFTDYILVACNNRFVYVLDRRTGKEVASTFCKAPVYCLTVGSKELIGCGDSFGNVYILRLA